MAAVQHRDGIHFDLSQRFVADSRSATGDVNIVTHAHADHLVRKDVDNVLCSPLTAALAEARNDIAVEFSNEHDDVELLPSGHIIGSTAARIRDNEKTYLYTGDVSTRDRCYMEGFDPVDADELIIETTYGVPAYTFPDQDNLEAEIADWLADSIGTPLFLFGYSLGRAQKLQYLVQQHTNRPIIAHGAVHKMNQVIEQHMEAGGSMFEQHSLTGVAAQHTDLAFDAVPYSDNKDRVEEDDAVFILPSRCARNEWVNNLVEQTGAMKAGFSGWAVADKFMYRGGYDATFPLSDHCDFQELVELVQAVDPEQVYTHHGYDEAFAAFLRDEYGYSAQSLKASQASLTEFA